MNQVYDVIIIGCGEAGIYAGYELSLKNPSLKIGVFEQGRDIYKRSCPIVAKKVKQCINCKVCDTMCGFGGAGAFSDGKFNFTTEFGGWLTDYMDHDEVMELIHYVDDVNVAHGATTSYFSTTTPEAQALAKKALEFDLHLLQAQCKHLGTEKNLMILTNIYEEKIARFVRLFSRCPSYFLVAVCDFTSRNLASPNRQNSTTDRGKCRIRLADRTAGTAAGRPAISRRTVCSRRVSIRG